MEEEEELITNKSNNVNKTQENLDHLTKDLSTVLIKPRHAEITFPLVKTGSKVHSNENFLGGLVELDEKIKSMYAKNKIDGTTTYTCQMCGKKDRSMSHMRDHMEANHIEGISLPCNICNKILRSRNCLRKHIFSQHKKHPGTSISFGKKCHKILCN